ncbi:hypothetical protein ACFOY4_01030 [Actinomadura syzygii]|uniref:Uncharacterized protein n=1 Tax=Actinomadura syzygii TaxID=1427538 RepID=A0A5D0TT90_9ACTN|nr:hypothetical protein [Actinomadura syzygii]TYC08660.1 hypothetical protein FXF65_37880 [Actinomadura syzygii]
MMDQDPTNPRPPDRDAEWDGTDADQFGRAVHLLNELVTALAALSRARAGEEAERLRAEELRYAQQRQRLRVVDRAEVAQILADYPARLRDLTQHRP